MKKLLLFVICSFPILLLAQVKFSVDILFSPEQAYRTLSPDDNITVIVRNETELKKFGYRYGLNLNIFLGDRVAFKTGIRMLDSGYDSSLDGVFFDYRFFEVPLGLRYYYSDSRFRYFTEIGGSANFYRNGFDDPLNEINSTNYSAYASLGLDFDYSPNLSIFLQPIFRYHVTETVKNVTIEEHLYSLGAEVGFRVKFFKE